MDWLFFWKRQKANKSATSHATSVKKTPTKTDRNTSTLIIQSLAEMAPVAAPWGQAVPPTEDAKELRDWLVRELEEQQLSAGAAGEALLDRILDALESDDLSLPPPPRIALELYELLQNDEVNINAVCATLEQDPILVQQVWIRASSAHFASRPTSLRFAVARIGLKELCRLSASSALTNHIFTVSKLREDAECVRRRSTVVAQVAERFNPGLGSAAYLGGLLHDVGSLFLLQHGTSESAEIQMLLSNLMRRYSPAVGMLVLSHWGLAQEITQSIGFQNNPAAAPPQAQQLSQLIRCASVAVYSAGRFKRGEDCGGLEVLAALCPPPVAPEEMLKYAIDCITNPGTSAKKASGQ